jgi:hypothetical protein
MSLSWRWGRAGLIARFPLLLAHASSISATLRAGRLLLSPSPHGRGVGVRGRASLGRRLRDFAKPFSFPSSLRSVRARQKPRAFGQPCGLPESLSLVWPRESHQREGHPSSAPSAHPCAPGSREAVGDFGQALLGLSKSLAASLRPTLRAIRPPPAAPQGPRAERGLLPAGATARGAELACSSSALVWRGWRERPCRSRAWPLRQARPLTPTPLPSLLSGSFEPQAPAGGLKAARFAPWGEGLIASSSLRTATTSNLGRSDLDPTPAPLALFDARTSPCAANGRAANPKSRNPNPARASGRFPTKRHIHAHQQPERAP